MIEPEPGTVIERRPRREKSQAPVRARKPRERRDRGGFASAVVGAVLEAWDELRVHRTRVLLSLIGVGVAVCSLTSVVGIGSIAQQSQIEQLERGSGRPATLVLSPPYNPVSGEQGDLAAFRAAVATAADRYSIGYWGSVSYGQTTVQFANGTDLVNAQTVDVDYGTMHRVQLGQGRWFTDLDEQRLAPAIIVSDAFYQRIGAPDLRTHPTATLVGERSVTAVMIGVLPSSPYDQSLQMYILNSAYAGIATPGALAQSVPQYEFWVPPALAAQLTDLVRRDISAALGDGWQVDVNRQDYLSWEGGGDPLGPIRSVLAGISVLILLLGALGLVNISLVTVRQRIREIGIRRSFGATAPRVFFAVMMESVVATVVAGAVGVLIAVFIVQNPFVRNLVASGLSDVPPFPVEAAIIGLASAALVGALAGLLPALVAVRVKVIDAIRY
ncbi:MAG: transporter permease [Rhodoglobus sp.]|nr:transporter permease [Rhodoglobus sp.]